MRLYLFAFVALLASCQQRGEPEIKPADIEAPTTPTTTTERKPLESEADAEVPKEVSISGAYGFDIRERYPIAWRAWKADLKKLHFAEADWLYELTGTADPITELTVGGRRYHRAWVCEPHNCGNNNTTLLIAPDQSRLVGLVQITDNITHFATRTAVGRPTSGEMACLQQLMNDVETDSC